MKNAPAILTTVAAPVDVPLVDVERADVTPVDAERADAIPVVVEREDAIPVVVEQADAILVDVEQADAIPVDAEPVKATVAAAPVAAAPILNRNSSIAGEGISLPFFLFAATETGAQEHILYDDGWTTEIGSCRKDVL